MKWLAQRVEWGEVHVLPLDDLIKHEESEDCVCGPTTEFCDPGWLVTHHSLDGREQAE